MSLRKEAKKLAMEKCGYDHKRLTQINWSEGFAQEVSQMERKLKKIVKTYQK